jgi:hypothetical protein
MRRLLSHRGRLLSNWGCTQKSPPNPALKTKKPSVSSVTFVANENSIICAGGCKKVLKTASNQTIFVEFLQIFANFCNFFQLFPLFSTSTCAFDAKNPDFIAAFFTL